jgi:hypothetical protein
MIVSLAQWLTWTRANRLWLASLAAAAILNAVFLALASLAPMGQIPGIRPKEAPNSVEIVMRRAPPPPDTTASEDPPFIFPPRHRDRARRSSKSEGGWGASSPSANRSSAMPGLNLGILRCDPDDREAMRRPDCAAPEWRGTASQDQDLDALAIARGWVKPKAEPRTRQSALSEETDASAPELRGSLFKDPPFPPHPSMPQSAGP